MNKRQISSSVRGLVCLGVLVALQLLPVSVKQQALSQESYKIGVTFPLSGSVGGFGQLNLFSLQMAVAEKNKKGGIYGREVKLVIEDTKGTAEGGLAAFRKVVEFDKVPVVMSMLTNVILVQIPYADSKKVVLISSVQSPGIAEKSYWNFVFADEDVDIIRMQIAYLKSLGAKRLFSFLVDNALGRYDLELFKKMWVDGQSGFYENAYFKLGETDFRGLVMRADAYKPDGIIVLCQGTSEGGLLIKQLREAGIKVPVLSNSSMLIPGVKKACAGTDEGVIFPDSPRSGEVYRQYAEEFKKRTGEDPFLLSLIWHDTPKMIMEAIEKKGYAAKEIRDYLANLKNFPLTGGGTTSFDAKKLASVPRILYQIKGGKPVPLSLK